MTKTIYQVECKKWVNGSGWSYSCIMDTLQDVDNMSDREMLKDWLDSKEFDESRIPENGDFVYYISTTILVDGYPVSVTSSDGIWLSSYLKGKEAK